MPTADTTAPTSYDEWLNLSDDERDRVHREVWNVYDRDGIGIATIAAGRLALVCTTKVLDMRIGTYHGGEFVLHMCVSDNDLPKMPEMLSQRFEGFRVIWMPTSNWR
ncbi:hypothetical protein [Prosthecobacter sp.]|uniref:hypothetical protein n=1 Tax=Prosthecobacter sp. TaxID=1965333 RepID=UPI002AC8D615|nr:hypothetical protein [Prosthecobacter sp.]